MFNTAYILVDRKPIRNLLRVERRARIIRIAVAIEIPGRIDEGVHGIRLAAGGLTALGTLHVYEFWDVFQRRPAFASDRNLQRKNHWQIALGNRNHAALRAIDDGDGRAPIALAR